MLKLEKDSKKDKDKKEDKGFWETLWHKGISIALDSLKSSQEETSLDNCKVNCNSLLYKIQYSDQLKSRDMVLEIASYCERFSL